MAKKKRIEVHYGTDEKGNSISALFAADSFRVEDGVLFVTDDGEDIFANKNAWVHVVDVDNANMLQPTARTEPVKNVEDEPTSSSVMPKLEPA